MAGWEVMESFCSNGRENPNAVFAFQKCLGRTSVNVIGVEIQ
jgi:hypothetical protein